MIKLCAKQVGIQNQDSGFFELLPDQCSASPRKLRIVRCVRIEQHHY